MLQRAVAVGFQNITSLAAATALTLPLGKQLATASSCSLSGSLLTVGGTVTGAFTIGQVVTGTGIPANTVIVGPAGPTNTWILSNIVATGTGIAVTGYAFINVDFALIRCSTAAVNWRDDGVAPTATVGFPMLTTDMPLEYAGNIGGIQFIAQSGLPTLQVSYYQLSG